MTAGVRLAAAFLAIGLCTPAWAGSYYCDGRPTTQRTCPDGSPVIYRADELQAPAKPQPLDPRGLIGRWHTSVPTAVIGREDKQRRWTEVFPGAAAGDLLIRPDGTYAWASWGGKKGRWVPGDREWPIVLIDTAEGKRWKVSFDARSGGHRIYIWDGDAINYGGSR